ncbi:MAG: hypothetical protein KF869_02895 [Phycisphaeraceae bacterium]|nr:hypothetical protein [Phycisphaeraceae bacterium]
MDRLLSVLAAAAVLFVVAESRAQFFDDFDGDALAPHWQTLWPEPDAWDYEVSGGLLTVNSLNLPSSFGSPTNYQQIRTDFTAVPGDFVATARMGFSPGAGRRVGMIVIGDQAGVLGQIGFHESGVLGIAAAGFMLVPMTLSPGLHEFTMERSGSQMSFFVNDVLVSTLATDGNQAVNRVRLTFDVDHPAGLPMSPMMVDRVSIVPAPATGAVAVIVLSLTGFRRRRR